jgi:hypothetical protein
MARPVSVHAKALRRTAMWRSYTIRLYVGANKRRITCFSRILNAGPIAYALQLLYCPTYFETTGDTSGSRPSLTIGKESMIGH